MTDIFLNIALISIFCLGWRTITDEGKILYFLRKPFENLKGWKQEVMKPVILCCACMASVWGTVIYWIFNYGEFAVIGIVSWIVCVVAASFVNSFGWSLLEWIHYNKYSDEKVDGIWKYVTDQKTEMNDIRSYIYEKDGCNRYEPSDKLRLKKNINRHSPALSVWGIVEDYFKSKGK